MVERSNREPGGEPLVLGQIHRRRFLAAATAAAGGALIAEGTWAAQPKKQPAAAPPAFLDLRDSNFITSVKDQGTCNACTAFAIVATVEATFNKKHGQNGAQGPDLDELELFSQPTSPHGGCNTSHWWPRDALLRCQSRSLAWEGNPAKPRLPIAGFQSLLDPNNKVRETQKAMKQWLVDTGPVAAVMIQYEDFHNWGKSWAQQYPGKKNCNVYTPGAQWAPCASTTLSSSTQSKVRSGAGSAPPPVPIVGGHVVSIVGYDDRGANKHWICKNSWGPTWNGDGYVLIAQGSPSASGPQGVGSCYIDFIDVWGTRMN